MSEETLFQQALSRALQERNARTGVFCAKVTHGAEMFVPMSD